MFAQQIFQWFKSAPRRQEVMVGGVFKHIRRDNIIETAKVLNIIPDSMGVPHVHFNVSIGSASRECFQERRTLGLATFAERFCLVTA